MPIGATVWLTSMFFQIFQQGRPERFTTRAKRDLGKTALQDAITSALLALQFDFSLDSRVSYFI
jgi:hypothetical protein